MLLSSWLVILSVGLGLHLESDEFLTSILWWPVIVHSVRFVLVPFRTSATKKSGLLSRFIVHICQSRWTEALGLMQTFSDKVSRHPSYGLE